MNSQAVINGVAALGRVNGHDDTSNQCGACHSTAIFTVVNQVDHSQVSGSCINRHNGAIAEGKNSGYRPANQECDACHGSTK